MVNTVNIIPAGHHFTFCHLADAFIQTRKARQSSFRGRRLKRAGKIEAVSKRARQKFVFKIKVRNYWK